MRSCAQAQLKIRRPWCHWQLEHRVSPSNGLPRLACFGRLGRPSGHGELLGGRFPSKWSSASIANAATDSERPGQTSGKQLSSGRGPLGGVGSARNDGPTYATTNSSSAASVVLESPEAVPMLESPHVATTSESVKNEDASPDPVPPRQPNEEVTLEIFERSSNGSPPFPEADGLHSEGYAEQEETLNTFDEAEESNGSDPDARNLEQRGEGIPGQGQRRGRKTYVWPELRTAETKDPEFEFLAVDPSDIPERRKSSQTASSSGRATKYMAPQRRGQRSPPGVKREPSAAAQACLTLLSEYKDPWDLPYEEFRESLRKWAGEQAPRRSDGMDVLRKLLEYQETQVFIMVAEFFMKEPWFRATLADHNKLLDVFVKNGLFLKAENRYRFMLAKGIPADRTTYNLMIQHYGLWKKTDRAEEMFLEMRTKNIRPNEDTYVALMGALTRAGRLVEAERLLKTMRKARCPRGPAAYVTLMEAYGREDEPEEAERIFLLIQADGIPLDRRAFLGLMHVYAELHKPHHVERVFRDMLSRRILPDETTYLVLIDSYRAAGLGKNCERLMDEMQVVGLSPYKAAALIMEAYGKEQLFSEAERILTDLEATTGLKPGVMHYNALLASYGRHGLHKDAMKVFDWMTSAGVALNKRSHVLILDLFDRTGRKANLRAAFRAMQSDGFGLEYEAAAEVVAEYRATLGEYELEAEEEREERLRKRAERAAKFMEKWDTWSRELDELDAEIAEVELAAERRMDKWESRTRAY